MFVIIDVRPGIAEVPTTAYQSVAEVSRDRHTDRQTTYTVVVSSLLCNEMHWLELLSYCTSIVPDIQCYLFVMLLCE